VLIAGYAFRDLLGLNDLWQAALVTVAYMVGAFAGTRIFKKLSETMFRRVILVALLALSLIGVAT
jgi:uncharacterized membrane protein YfcA